MNRTKRTAFLREIRIKLVETLLANGLSRDQAEKKATAWFKANPFRYSGNIRRMRRAL